MRRKLRERSQAASSMSRKRRRRAEEDPACEVKEEEEILIPELDELLLRSEDSAWWKEENGGRAEDSSLADLLQQLCDEDCDASPALSTNNMAPSKAGAPPGTNKNAQAARLNRLRKKEYVRGLEGQVARLSEDNRRLEGERRELGVRVHRLEEETRYLRAVLANDSALSHLLGRLTDLGGVKLTTSLFSEKKPREHDYALPASEPEPPSGGGVCLHVDQEKVSVEFCPACSRSASCSAKM